MRSEIFATRPNAKSRVGITLEKKASIGAKERIVNPEKRIFDSYTTMPHNYDEFFAAQKRHAELAPIIHFFSEITLKEFRSLHFLAKKLLRERGVTFRVYKDKVSKDHTFPFDLLPRIIDRNEWERISLGLKQRITALNAFLGDIYGKGHALNDKVIPRDLVESSAGYLAIARGIKPPGGVYIHVSGIDLIRDHHGKLFLLEDNLRVPSGISYAIENREIMKLFFSDIFKTVPIREINEYSTMLRHQLTTLKNTNLRGNTMVLLTPGPLNSAYFEHKFLAHAMSCDLVQGDDLFVENEFVYKKSDKTRVDIVYRRIDDEYLDPRALRKDSLIGVPGIFDAYAKGNVLLANAIGNGVADDKCIYPYVPKLIRYYLAEEPILQQVETYSCFNTDQQKYVLENLSSLVVKLANASGGYGMVMGHEASKADLCALKLAILKEPRSYIAQPLIQLSSLPTFDENAQTLAPRHIDFRPYCLSGNDIYIAPGGLSRVALKPGSFVVNSCQGGGSKDTWVLE